MAFCPWENERVIQIKETQNRLGILTALIGLTLLVTQWGCGAKDEESEDSGGGDAVGGTMEISVPSPYQMDVVQFVAADGQELAKIECLGGKTYSCTRADGSVVKLVMEKRQLQAIGPDDTPLFLIARKGDWVDLIVEGETDPLWRIKYSGSDVEVYAEGETPLLTFRWIENELHLLGAEDVVQAITAIQEGATVLRDGDGELLMEAQRMADPLSMACLGVPGMDLVE